MSVNSEMHLMLFDLEFTGHHSNYIRLVINHWLEHQVKDKLTVVVCPEFFEHHKAVVALANSGNQGNVSVRSITVEENDLLASRGNRLNRFFRRLQEWRLLRQYASRLEANHCLIMLIDQLQLPIMLHWDLPCLFSGIYFLPSLHYFTFEEFTSSPSLFLKSLRDRAFLWRLSNHPVFHKLLSLDPYAVDFISHNLPKVRINHLPDPVALIEPLAQEAVFAFKEKQNIDSQRKVFLVFGNLDERKGIFQILESLQKLDKYLHQKICLVFAGKANPAFSKQFNAKVSKLLDRFPLQIISRFEFLVEQEVNSWFEVANVILAPYQNHIGMSGILLLAAAHQKPVISQDFGLMGETVRKFKLGLTVDSFNPESIAMAIGDCAINSPDSYCNRQLMSKFANIHDSNNFVFTLLENIRT